MDDLISSVYRSVADNISIPEGKGKGKGGNDTRICHIDNSSVGYNDTSLFRNVFNSFRLESDHSVEDVTNRVFYYVTFICYLI